MVFVISRLWRKQEADKQVVYQSWFSVVCYLFPDIYVTNIATRRVYDFSDLPIPVHGRF